MSSRLVAAVLGAGLAIPASALADIVITEIHYAPVDASGAPRPDLELVEVYNDGSEPYDLSGYRFTRGFSFEFPGRTFIGAQSYLVVCRDVVAVKAYYGITNALGDFPEVLDNAGETIELANPQGAVVSSVPYNDRGRWPSGAKGTGHSLSILYPYSDPSDPDNWALSAQMGGTPGADNFGGLASFQDTVIVNVGETWRYFKGTEEASSPVTAWRGLGFSDSSWLSGPTGIGYDDGDDATVLADMRNGYMSIFCRKAFTVADVSQIESLVLSIDYDDGFVAYLNGTEVARRGLTGNPPAFDAGATSHDAGSPEDIDVTSSKGLLQTGTNVLAVQVHNTNLTSTDLSFIPKLVSRRVIQPTQTATVPVVINEGYTRNGGSGQRFVELCNTSSSAVDVSGYWLSNDFASLKKYAIPSDTSIPGRGLLAFTEAQLGFSLAYAPVTAERIHVALTNPAGTRVTDAVIFEPHADGRSEARVPDGDRRFEPAASPTPGSPNAAPVEDGVVFNEIMYHPISDDDTHEYIELYNRGAAAVDISGWSVEGVGLTFLPGTTIGPSAYLVIARDPAGIEARYSLSGGVVLPTPWTGNLRDGGERLNLLDAAGNVADTVRYHDGGDWTIWPDGGGSSLELIDPWADNDAALSWDASDDSAKAAVQSIIYSGVPYGGGESDIGIMLAERGIMIIDDVSLVRTGGGTNLISNSTFDVNTTPWRIEGTHIRSGRTTDAAERITGVGSLKLICWNGSGDYKVNRVETDTATQTTGTYTVSFKARWRVGSPRVITIGDYNVGQPSNPGLAGSNQVAVPRNLGTPGAENSVTARQVRLAGSSNIGPSIDKVSHSPGVPEASEQVAVRARVRDPNGVSSVRLYFRTEAPEGAFTLVNLTDADSDGVYTGTVPGQALGVRVLFYVEATDGSGAVSRYPADLFKRTHPPVLNPASPAPNEHHYCMYRHDTRIVSTPHHSYRFVLNETSEEYLRTRRTHSNEMVNGTFVFGSGDVYYNAQIRYAGSPWLREASFNNSYAFRMPKDKPLHGRKKAFNIDEHGSDGRERISHYLLRQNAASTLLPYHDTQTLVRFQLNDVKDATFEALDKPNAQYMELWFPGSDTGPFFEMDDRFGFNDSGNRTSNADGRALYPPYGATTGGDNKENYRWFFAPRAHESADDFQPLLDFCYLMDSRTTSNTAFDQQVFDYIDAEELLRVWAIEMNIDDWDTWGGNRGKNAYLYQSPVDGLWRKVPWDLELTYGNAGAFAMPSSPTSTYSNAFSEIQRMINRPRLKRMYYGILAEMVDTATGFFHSGFLTPYMQQIQAAGVGGTGAGTAGGFIDTRAGSIRGWIRAAVYPQVRLAISTNGGAPIATLQPTVDLAGTAPADVFFLIVVRNGTFLDDPAPPVAFSTTDMTGWTIAGIPLVPGANSIEVLGIGSKGDVVDSDTIQVTSSANWPPPAITSVDPASGAGGDAVTVTGTGFHDGLRAFFGAVEAQGVRFSEATDPTRAGVTVPSGLPEGPTTVKVRNIDGQESSAVAFTVTPPPPEFVRGDGNLDGIVDLSDGVKVLLHLFGGLPGPCADALDADDSGTVDLTDALRVLNYLFKQGSAPASPFPARGRDATADSLGCERGL
ncbi:MAG: lamin tail domain-containing protein [Planctomycetes bacterium]|nr:lamin tail domain-containing protein [Planctomycetota bacterium]